MQGVQSSCPFPAATTCKLCLKSLYLLSLSQLQYSYEIWDINILAYICLGTTWNCSQPVRDWFALRWLTDNKKKKGSSSSFMEWWYPISSFAPEEHCGFAGTQELWMVLVILTHFFEAHLASQERNACWLAEHMHRTWACLIKVGKDLMLEFQLHFNRVCRCFS